MEYVIIGFVVGAIVTGLVGYGWHRNIIQNKATEWYGEAETAVKKHWEK